MNNSQEPASKQDLADLENKLLRASKEDLAELENKILQGTKQDLAVLESRLENKLIEVMREIETNLLRAFYPYTESTAKHFAELDRSNGSLRERVGDLEKRVMDIERRINFPHFNP